MTGVDEVERVHRETIAMQEEIIRQQEQTIDSLNQILSSKTNAPGNADMVESLGKLLEDRNTTITFLRGVVKERGEAIKRLEEALQQPQKGDTTSAVAALRERIRILEDELLQKDEELEYERKRNQESEQHIRELQADLTKLEQIADELQAENQELDTALRRKGTEVATGTTSQEPANHRQLPPQGAMISLTVTVIEAHDLVKEDWEDVKEPFIGVTVGKTSRRSKAVPIGPTLRFDETMRFSVPQAEWANTLVEFEMCDDATDTDGLGFCRYRLRDLPPNSPPRDVRLRLGESSGGLLVRLDAKLEQSAQSADQPTLQLQRVIADQKATIDDLTAENLRLQRMTEKERPNLEFANEKLQAENAELRKVVATLKQQVNSDKQRTPEESPRDPAQEITALELGVNVCDVRRGTTSIKPSPSVCLQLGSKTVATTDRITAFQFTVKGKRLPSVLGGSVDIAGQLYQGTVSLRDVPLDGTTASRIISLKNQTGDGGIEILLELTVLPTEHSITDVQTENTRPRQGVAETQRSTPVDNSLELQRRLAAAEAELTTLRRGLSTRTGDKSPGSVEMDELQLTRGAPATVTATGVVVTVRELRDAILSEEVMSGAQPLVVRLRLGRKEVDTKPGRQVSATSIRFDDSVGFTFRSATPEYLEVNILYGDRAIAHGAVSLEEVLNSPEKTSKFVALTYRDKSVGALHIQLEPMGSAATPQPNPGSAERQEAALRELQRQNQDLSAELLDVKRKLASHTTPQPLPSHLEVVVIKAKGVVFSNAPRTVSVIAQSGQSAPQRTLPRGSTSLDWHERFIFAVNPKESSSTKLDLRLVDTSGRVLLSSLANVQELAQGKATVFQCPLTDAQGNRNGDLHVSAEIVHTVEHAVREWQVAATKLAAEVADRDRECAKQEEEIEDLRHALETAREAAREARYSQRERENSVTSTNTIEQQALQITVLEARDVPLFDWSSSRARPWCEVRVTGATPTSRRTASCDGCLNPIWNETFAFILSQRVEYCRFEVILFDAGGTDEPQQLGKGELPIAELLATTSEGKRAGKWLTLRGPEGGAGGEVHISVQLTAAIEAYKSEAARLQQRLTEGATQVAELERMLEERERECTTLRKQLQEAEVERAGGKKGIAVTLIEARGLRRADQADVNRPAARLSVGNTAFHTRTGNGTAPQWKETFEFSWPQRAVDDALIVELFDKSKGGNDHLGRCTVRLLDVLTRSPPGAKQELWVDLQQATGAAAGKARLSVRVTGAEARAVRITMAGDISTFNEGFFRQAVAAQLGIPTDAIHVIDVSPGSTVVDLQLRQTDDGTVQSPDQLAQKLLRLANDNGSTLAQLLQIRNASFIPAEVANELAELRRKRDQLGRRQEELQSKVDELLRAQQEQQEILRQLREQEPATGNAPSVDRMQVTIAHAELRRKARRPCVLLLLGPVVVQTLPSSSAKWDETFELSFPRNLKDPRIHIEVWEEDPSTGELIAQGVMPLPTQPRSEQWVELEYEEEAAGRVHVLTESVTLDLREEVEALRAALTQKQRQLEEQEDYAAELEVQLKTRASTSASELQPGGSIVVSSIEVVDLPRTAKSDRVVTIKLGETARTTTPSSSLFWPTTNLVLPVARGAQLLEVEVRNEGRPAVVAEGAVPLDRAGIAQREYWVDLHNDSRLMGRARVTLGYLPPPTVDELTSAREEVHRLQDDLVELEQENQRLRAQLHSAQEDARRGSATQSELQRLQAQIQRLEQTGTREDASEITRLREQNVALSTGGTEVEVSLLGVRELPVGTKMVAVCSLADSTTDNEVPLAERMEESVFFPHPPNGARSEVLSAQVLECMGESRRLFGTAQLPLSDVGPAGDAKWMQIVSPQGYPVGRILLGVNLEFPIRQRVKRLEAQLLEQKRIADRLSKASELAKRQAETNVIVSIVDVKDPPTRAFGARLMITDGLQRYDTEEKQGPHNLWGETFLFTGEPDVLHISYFYNDTSSLAGELRLFDLTPWRNQSKLTTTVGLFDDEGRATSTAVLLKMKRYSIPEVAEKEAVLKENKKLSKMLADLQSLGTPQTPTSNKIGVNITVIEIRDVDLATPCEVFPEVVLNGTTQRGSVVQFNPVQRNARLAESLLFITTTDIQDARIALFSRLNQQHSPLLLGSCLLHTAQVPTRVGTSVEKWLPLLRSGNDPAGQVHVTISCEPVSELAELQHLKKLHEVIASREAVVRALETENSQLRAQLGPKTVPTDIQVVLVEAIDLPDDFGGNAGMRLLVALGENVYEAVATGKRSVWNKQLSFALNPSADLVLTLELQEGDAVIASGGMSLEGLFPVATGLERWVPLTSGSGPMGSVRLRFIPAASLESETDGEALEDELEAARFERDRFRRDAHALADHVAALNAEVLALRHQLKRAVDQVRSEETHALPTAGVLARQIREVSNCQGEGDQLICKLELLQANIGHAELLAMGQRRTQEGMSSTSPRTVAEDVLHIQICGASNLDGLEFDAVAVQGSPPKPISLSNTAQTTLQTTWNRGDISAINLELIRAGRLVGTIAVTTDGVDRKNGSVVEKWVLVRDDNGRETRGAVKLRLESRVVYLERPYVAGDSDRALSEKAIQIRTLRNRLAAEQSRVARAELPTTFVSTASVIEGVNLRLAEEVERLKRGDANAVTQIVTAAGVVAEWDEKLNSALHRAFAAESQHQILLAEVEQLKATLQVAEGRVVSIRTRQISASERTLDLLIKEARDLPCDSALVTVTINDKVVRLPPAKRSGNGHLWNHRIQLDPNQSEGAIVIGVASFSAVSTELCSLRIALKDVLQQVNVDGWFDKWLAARTKDDSSGGYFHISVESPKVDGNHGTEAILERSEASATHLQRLLQQRTDELTDLRKELDSSRVEKLAAQRAMEVCRGQLEVALEQLQLQRDLESLRHVQPADIKDGLAEGSYLRSLDISWPAQSVEILRDALGRVESVFMKKNRAMRTLQEMASSKQAVGPTQDNRTASTAKLEAEIGELRLVLQAKQRVIEELESAIQQAPKQQKQPLWLLEAKLEENALAISILERNAPPLSLARLVAEQGAVINTLLERIHYLRGDLLEADQRTDHAILSIENVKALQTELTRSTSPRTTRDTTSSAAVMGLVVTVEQLARHHDAALDCLARLATAVGLPAQPLGKALPLPISQTPTATGKPNLLERSDTIQWATTVLEKVRPFFGAALPAFEKEAERAFTKGVLTAHRVEADELRKLVTEKQRKIASLEDTLADLRRESRSSDAQQDLARTREQLARKEKEIEEQYAEIQSLRKKTLELSQPAPVHAESASALNLRLEVLNRRMQQHTTAASARSKGSPLDAISTTERLVGQLLDVRGGAPADFVQRTRPVFVRRVFAVAKDAKRLATELRANKDKASGPFNAAVKVHEDLQWIIGNCFSETEKLDLGVPVVDPSKRIDTVRPSRSRSRSADRATARKSDSAPTSASKQRSSKKGKKKSSSSSLEGPWTDDD
eukprot:TRINITY_DN7554_c0_g1_i1.p1 TRINITY_DN7554_c0_g1~~TRINITY_DN7554_c0_g1_i1.p1  ORF type:complete len:3485 (-),score=617.89 TRINITY_DN7554_c0_g1_i1:13-10434(-)